MIFDGLLLLIILAQGMFIWNMRTLQKTLNKEIETLGKALELQRSQLVQNQKAITQLQDFFDSLQKEVERDGEFAMESVKLIKDELNKLNLDINSYYDRIDQVEKVNSQTYVKMEKGLC